MTDWLIVVGWILWGLCIAAFAYGICMRRRKAAKLKEIIDYHARRAPEEWTEFRKTD